MPEKTITLTDQTAALFEKLQRTLDADPNMPTLSDNDLIALGLIALDFVNKSHSEMTCFTMSHLIIGDFKRYRQTQK